MASFELSKIKSAKCPMSEVEGHIIPQLHLFSPCPTLSFVTSDSSHCFQVTTLVSSNGITH